MKTVKRNLHGVYIMFAFVFCTTSIAFAQENKAANDSAFITKNILDNTIEIKLLKMAEQKAEDAQIKKAASQIMADHTTMLNDLKKIAVKKNIPGIKDTINGKAEAGLTNPGMQELVNATGKDFEKLWLSQMSRMHTAKIAELEAAAGQLADAELKSVVNKSLPKIRMHKDMLVRIGYKFKE